MAGNGLRPQRLTSRRRSIPRSPSEYGSSPQGEHTGDNPIDAEIGIENPLYAAHQHESIETETSASRRSSVEAKKGKRSPKACDNCKAKKRKCSGNQDCNACKIEGIICHFTYVDPNAAKLTYSAQQMASSQQKCELLEWKLKELHARYLRVAVQPGGCPMNYGSGAELLMWLQADPVTGPPPAHSSRMSGSENVKLPRHMGGSRLRRPTRQQNRVIEPRMEIEFPEAADDFDGAKTNEVVEMTDILLPASPGYFDQSSTLRQDFQPVPVGQELQYVPNNPDQQIDFALAPEFTYETGLDWGSYFHSLRFDHSYHEPPRDQ